MFSALNNFLFLGLAVHGKLYVVDRSKNSGLNFLEGRHSNEKWVTTFDKIRSDYEVCCLPIPFL